MTDAVRRITLGERKTLPFRGSSTKSEGSEGVAARIESTIRLSNEQDQPRHAQSTHRQPETEPTSDRTVRTSKAVNFDSWCKSEHWTRAQQSLLVRRSSNTLSLRGGSLHSDLL